MQKESLLVVRAHQINGPREQKFPSAGNIFFTQSLANLTGSLAQQSWETTSSPIPPGGFTVPHGWVHKGTSPNYKFCTVSAPRSFLFKVAFWRLKVVRWSRDIKLMLITNEKKEKTLGVILHEGLYRRQHWLQVLHFLRVSRKAFPSTRPPSTGLLPQV